MASKNLPNPGLTHIAKGVLENETLPELKTEMVCAYVLNKLIYLN